MKGNERITIKVTRPNISGGFDVTETWDYQRDNTSESLEEILEVFEKMLVCLGFHFDGKLDLVRGS